MITFTDLVLPIKSKNKHCPFCKNILILATILHEFSSTEAIGEFNCDCCGAVSERDFHINDLQIEFSSTP